MDGPIGHYAKRNKLEKIEGQMPYEFPSLWNLKQNKLEMDIYSKLMVVEGGGVGWE